MRKAYDVRQVAGMSEHPQNRARAERLGVEVDDHAARDVVGYDPLDARQGIQGFQKTRRCGHVAF